MCGGAPILRVIATVFLVIAFIAALLGYVAPFWTEKVGSESTPSPTFITPALGSNPGVATSSPGFEGLPATTTKSAGKQKSDGSEKFHWEGLWAKCYENLTCSCFAQHGFAMELEFPDWHKAVQGLFGAGLIILLVVILTISCNICCCRCCKQSMAIATACGVLTIIGMFVILASLAVYGTFAYLKLGVGLTGPNVRFFWGFYLSIAAAGLAIIPAILFICDGRREVLPEHEDCETTRMV